MAEYISKDKFIHFLFKEIAYFEETQTDIEIPISATLQSVVNEIKKFTSEDVQPVVRCINCKYYEGLACCKLIGDCGGTNWFCGWGEPKEET